MLTRRERIIVLVAALALSVLTLDRLVVTPVLNRQAELDARRADLVEELLQAQRLIRAKRDSQPRWRQIASDVLPRDPSEAESRLLHAVRSWSRESGLSLTSVQPERPHDKGDLRQVWLSVTASGSLASVTQFLYQLEQSDLPVTAQRLRLSATQGREGLTMVVKLSTLYQANPPAGNDAPGAAARSGATGRPR